MDQLAKMHEDMIDQGSHALIIKDARTCTMQPLTKQGATGMRRMLKAIKAPAQFIEGIDRKLNGLYVAAIPTENRDAMMLASELALWISGGVSILETEEELPVEQLKPDA